MPSGVIPISRGRSGAAFLILTVMTTIVTILFMCVGVKWGAIGMAIADAAATYFLIMPRLYYGFKDSPVIITVFSSAVSGPHGGQPRDGSTALMLLYAGCPGFPRSLHWP